MIASRMVEVVVLLLVASLPSILLAQGQNPDPAQEAQKTEARRTQLNQLIGTVKRIATTPPSPQDRQTPMVRKTGQEYLYSLSAPPGAQFDVQGASGRPPEEVADMFVAQWRNLLARDDPAIRFSKRRIRTLDNHTSVRYRQTLSGLEVHASTLIVQTNTTGGVEAVVNDIMHDSEALASQQLSLQPVIDRQDAENRAVHWMSERYAKLRFQPTPAELVVYSPVVVGRIGDAQLTWRTEVGSTDDSSVRELILVDARTGDIAFHHTLVFHALNRWVYDYVDKGIRSDPNHTKDPNGFHDEVNRAFDYLGDTYNFYWDHCEQRDSWNDQGGQLIAWVRYGTWAYWNGSYIELGPGTVTDDTIGHELTHAVTDLEIGSTYSGESAAIKESFCDMFGEWIDQEYNHNSSYDIQIYGENKTFNDDNDVDDWVLFEDDTTIPASLKPWRRMDNPTQIYTNEPNIYGQDFDGNHAQPDYRPDLPASPPVPWYGNWYTGNQDSGGAHHNVGVGNKLCYLVTSGFDIPKAASLFYEAMLLLPDGCDYFDLYFALIQAAINKDFSLNDRLFVRAQCEAVAIIPDTEEDDWALESHWRLDETSGTTADDSAGTNDGTVSGATWVTGKLNNALTFDGTNDYVSLWSLDALEGRSASICAWVKASSVADQYDPIMTQYDDGSVEGYYLCLNYGKPTLYLNVPEAQAANSISTGDWHHIVGTYDGLALRIYVDGTLADDANEPHQSGISHTAYIGASGTGNNFNGLIDDVRVYNFALSEEEVADLAAYGEPMVFRVLNASAVPIALIDEEGNLFLKGTLTSGTVQASANDEFRVQAGSQDVAIIDMATGNMVIAGTSHENQTDLSGAGNFIIKNWQNNVVAYIDASGNLYLKGKVCPNWDF